MPTALKRAVLVTLSRQPFGTRPMLTFCAAEDHADVLIDALGKEGWQTLDRVYWPPTRMIDSLQAALLEVSTLPAAAPVRVAVELAASAAILGAPLSAK